MAVACFRQGVGGDSDWARVSEICERLGLLEDGGVREVRTTLDVVKPAATTLPAVLFLALSNSLGGCGSGAGGGGGRDWLG